MIKNKLFQSSEAWRRFLLVIPVISLILSVVFIVRAANVNPYNLIIIAVLTPLYWLMLNVGAKISLSIRHADDIGLVFINNTVFSMVITYVISFFTMNAFAFILPPLLGVIVNVISIVISGVLFVLIKKTDFNIIAPGAIETGSVGTEHKRHDENIRINPANGVPMISSSNVDVQGNTYGNSGHKPN